MSSWIEYTAPKWRDLQMRDLKVDEAYLVPISDYDDEVYIYSLSDECYACPFAKVKAILANDTVEPLKINVAHPISFKVFDKNVGRYAPNNLTALCTMHSPMDEFGVYNFSINSDGSCAIETDKPGVNVNLSIVSVVLLGIFVTVIVKLVLFASKRFRTLSASQVAINVQDQENNDKVVIRKKRVLSIDTFRGLAITLMIFANSGGGGYWWIEHAPWNGLHLADIVFPFFLWVMGVCLPISIKSELSRGSSKKSLCQKIVWRSIKMFLIGVCLNSVNGPQLANLRIMGVLQRIAVAYLVAGVFYTLFAKKEYVLPQPQSRFMQPICELILLKEHIIFMFLLVAISLGIMFGIAAPGCPRGYIGPGGKDSYAAHPNCIGGIIGYIDRKILGASHIYQYPGAKRLYDAKAFDPEGVFGCLLTIVHAVLGAICGCIMIMHTEWVTRMKRWACWGFGLGILAGILCLFSKENGWIPLNKNLWSLSFVLATSSLAFFLLTFLYYLIDVREIGKGFPFSECGKNAIILYVGHSVFHKMLPWHWVIGPMNTHFILLLRATTNTTLWVATAVYLDKIKFYYTL